MAALPDLRLEYPKLLSSVLFQFLHHETQTLPKLLSFDPIKPILVPIKASHLKNIFTRCYKSYFMSSSVQIQRLTQFLRYKTTSILSSQHLFQTHAQLITTGLHSRPHSSPLLALFQLYLSNPSTLSHATTIFHQIQQPNSQKWRLMIRKHTSDGKPLQAVSLFRQMLTETNPINPLDDDPFIYASLIKACNKIGGFAKVLRGCFGSSARPNHVSFVILISGSVEYGGPSIGTTLHSCCCKMGLDLNKDVCNVLIDFYTKFGGMNDAFRLFSDMPEKDLVSWNTMIASYVKNNEYKKAISLFKEMRRRLIEVDRVSLISLISACANSKDLDTGKVIHGHIKGSGIETTVPVGTALINMYSKCRVIEFARKVFNEMPKENIVSWNSLIHGFLECGLSNEALRFFNRIQSCRLKADEVTMLGLILACRDSGELNDGAQVHSYTESSGLLTGSTLLSNALIDMYAKCGSMTRARSVFDKMSSRDVISWTSIIMGYAISGEGEEALAAFRQMVSEKILPNSITFIAVLSACNHAGLVDYGQTLYNTMRKVYCIEPMIEHCGCMVDMHARAGMLEEAHRFVKMMPVEPNAIIWRMLMNACRVHGHFDLGLNLVSGLMELRTSRGSEDHVIFSNIFAEAGKWDDVICQRSLMAVQEASKVAGRSLVHV
ncbi:hypothetical protein LguiA_028227 [Lonicera macranthoides]